MTTVAPSAPAHAPAGHREVSPAEAKLLVSSGQAIIVDVREPDEHAAEHIRGAYLMPLSRFNPAELSRFRGKKVIIHCRGGKRSLEACRLAGACEGVELLNLTGGLQAWKAQNQPVEIGRGPAISVMRQVQLTIGVGVLAGAVLAWFVDPRWVGLCAFFGAGLSFAGATGTCGLASILARMPWNRTVPAAPASQSACCGDGACR